jgi:outer membrane receptor protein involved in Fe transport
VTTNNARCQKSAIALAVSSILAGGSTAARAQEAPVTADLGEVIVTATRREQAIQDVPFNISALSGDALEKANIIDSVEALRTMPGISVQDRGYRNGGVTSSVVIRGINVDAGSNGDVPLAAPPTVATYVDNTPLFGNFILKDIERVEVLRGPQGTLYGSGSLAGNVRYIMNKPDLSGFIGEASIGYGQTDGSDGSNFNPDVMLNMPLGETFAVRFNAGMIDNDGIVDYPHVYVLDANGDPVVNGDVVTALPEYRRVKDADDVEITYGRFSALFAPNDVWSAQLSYQRQEDEVGGRRQVTSGDDLVNGGQYGEYEFGAIQLEPSDREVELAALEVEVDLGFATLTSSTSHYDHTGTGISDNSGVYARNGWFAFYGSSPRPIAQAERFYDDSALTQEFRLVSNGDQRVDWTFGLFYMDQDYDLGQNSFLVGYIPYLDALDWYGIAPYTTNQDFLFRRGQQYEEKAIFGEVTFNLQDSLHLTVGGRYFDNEVDVDALVDVPIYAVFGPPGSASETISDDDFLAKVNLAWDVTEDSMLYLTYAQGYRHAGANAVPTTGKYAENPDFFTFDSDSVDNYEIGYKGSNDQLNWTVSLYYNDWDKPQLNTATSNWGFFAAINGESAKTQGIEIELSGRLGDSFSYNLGYTYADSELTDDVFQPAGNFYGGPLFIDRVGADGDRLPGSAEHVFTVSLRHDMTFSNDVELTTVLSGYYQSEVSNSLGDDVCLTSFNAIGNCVDSPNPASVNYAPTSVFSRSFAEIDGFDLWNLSVTGSKDSWSASVYVKNLFNEEGTTGVFPFLVGGPQTDSSQNYFGNNSRDYIALPRTIGLTVGYRF